VVCSDSVPEKMDSITAWNNLSMWTISTIIEHLALFIFP
uniref:Leptin receptor n=1 Tax=Globodera pallida TaxID=36090 RepID=A0A183CP92_GLOPA